MLGDWGEFATYEYTPPSDEELWTGGIDQTNTRQDIIATFTRRGAAW
jgi:hypothetical protein